MTLETPRLIMTPLSRHDWELFERLHTTASVIKYVTDPLQHSDIKARFESRLFEWHKGSNHWLTLTIREKSTGEKVGVTGLLPTWDPHRQAEIGFLLCPQFQRKGYAKESSIALLEFAFRQCNFDKVIATVTAGNSASYLLLKGLGFTHENTVKHNIKLGGQWHDDLVLGLSRSSYHSLYLDKQ